VQELPEALTTVLLDEVLPVPPRELWRLVMADPAFFRHMQAHKRVSELRLGRWQLTGSALPLFLQPLASALLACDAFALAGKWWEVGRGTRECHMLQACMLRLQDGG
jgi:hypothetical protein